MISISQYLPLYLYFFYLFSVFLFNLFWVFFWSMCVAVPSAPAPVEISSSVLCLPCCSWCVTYFRFERRFVFAKSLLTFRFKKDSVSKVLDLCIDSVAYLHSFLLESLSRYVGNVVVACLICFWIGIFLQVLWTLVSGVISVFLRFNWPLKNLLFVGVLLNSSLFSIKFVDEKKNISTDELFLNIIKFNEK